MDRPNEGFGRGNVQSNNTRAQQPAQTERPQWARQYDGWSSPTNIDRGDDTERHQMPQVPPSEVPLLQKKDCIPTGAVKILQEKEWLNVYYLPEVLNLIGPRIKQNKM